MAVSHRFYCTFLFVLIVFLLLFCTSFTLFDLEERNEYLIDLNVSLCLHDGGNCVFVTTIFDQAVLTKSPCSLNQGYIKPGKLN